jgi:hypothetical protein
VTASSPTGGSGRHEEDGAMTTRAGRVTCDLTITLDGYAAGLNQSEARPFGDDGGDGWGTGCTPGTAKVRKRTPRSSRA